MLQHIVYRVMERRHTARALRTGPKRGDLRDDIVQRPVAIVIVLRLRALNVGRHSHLAQLLTQLLTMQMLLLLQMLCMRVVRLGARTAAAVRHCVQLQHVLRRGVQQTLLQLQLHLLLMKTR